MRKVVLLLIFLSGIVALLPTKQFADSLAGDGQSLICNCQVGSGALPGGYDCSPGGNIVGQMCGAAGSNYYCTTGGNSVYGNCDSFAGQGGHSGCPINPMQYCCDVTTSKYAVTQRCGPSSVHGFYCSTQGSKVYGVGCAAPGPIGNIYSCPSNQYCCNVTTSPFGYTTSQCAQNETCFDNPNIPGQIQCRGNPGSIGGGTGGSGGNSGSLGYIPQTACIALVKGSEDSAGGCRTDGCKPKETDLTGRVNINAQSCNNIPAIKDGDFVAGRVKCCVPNYPTPDPTHYTPSKGYMCGTYGQNVIVDSANVVVHVCSTANGDPGNVCNPNVHPGPQCTAGLDGTDTCPRFPALSLPTWTCGDDGNLHLCNKDQDLHPYPCADHGGNCTVNTGDVTDDTCIGDTSAPDKSAYGVPTPTPLSSSNGSCTAQHTKQYGGFSSIGTCRGACITSGTDAAEYPDGQQDCANGYNCCIPIKIAGCACSSNVGYICDDDTAKTISCPQNTQCINPVKGDATRGRMCTVFRPLNSQYKTKITCNDNCSAKCSGSHCSTILNLQLTITSQDQQGKIQAADTISSPPFDSDCSGNISADGSIILQCETGNDPSSFFSIAGTVTANGIDVSIGFPDTFRQGVVIPQGSTWTGTLK